MSLQYMMRIAGVMGAASVLLEKMPKPTKCTN
jgi:hypothetical protein